ncbi:anthranilate synthase component I family protein [Bacillus carboniphilus]|uniref:Anthranilate synthase component I family protein n=1 Tax=Bacillus carboniphilus TaxID=86663 RepID=A0ABY9JRB5_9BACI|nr:anthranilate synthase component I family protein [Bacillus carboniphilus]WLR41946.1 anthranilate synthase component I family protein [Bacillus carboniphilus]
MQRDHKLLSEKIPYSKSRFFSQYKRLSVGVKQHILLESGRGGRYSIAGINPIATLEGKDHVTTIKEVGKEEKVKKGNPLIVFGDWMKEYEIPEEEHLPDFQGGAIGFISYDSVRYFETLPTLSEDDLDIPDLYFMVFDKLAVYDEIENTLILICLDFLGKRTLESDLEEWTKLWKQDLQRKESREAPIQTQIENNKSFSNRDFQESVKKVQEYIAQGDVFQVNLSVRKSEELKTHPFYIYEELRRLNPSPYMSYIETPQFQVVSGSPELLVKKKGDKISTRPIAGTRSRGKDDEDDLRLANELMSNKKERAEHIMLVDLERNDLGRVSEYGSVFVDEFMTIEKYSHVMHIVSNVQGDLRNDVEFADIIRAVFPGGTITGAPKVRTMEIIEELEPTRRGLYTGSIGWVGFNGNFELNIVIRTLIAKQGQAFVQAGAGIVIDSKPELEYKESLKKAMALWKAKQMSEAENVKV